MTKQEKIVILISFILVPTIGVVLYFTTGKFELSAFLATLVLITMYYWLHILARKNYSKNLSKIKHEDES